MLLSIRPERAEAPSLGQRPRYLFMQTLPPCKGKSISLSGILCFCPYRAHLLPTFTQGVALGLGLAGLSARPTLLGACSSQPCLVLVRPNLAWCLFVPTLLGACSPQPCLVLVRPNLAWCLLGYVFPSACQFAIQYVSIV